MKFLFVNGRIRIASTTLSAGFPLFILLLVFGGILLAAFWFMVPMASAYFVPPPPPTQEYMWSYVEIAKPTSATPLVLPVGTAVEEPASIVENIPSVVPVDTVTPLPTATETPAQLSMEILADTPTPVYVAPEKPVYAQASYTYGGSKYILVDISEQHMYVYEGDVLVYSFVASTGINNATRVGTFAVQSKIPNAYGPRGTLDAQLAWYLLGGRSGERNPCPAYSPQRRNLVRGLSGQTRLVWMCGFGNIRIKIVV
jgi:hypothetical protein